MKQVSSGTGSLALACGLLVLNSLVADAQPDPGPATGHVIDRAYDDGFVRVDITGNNHGGFLGTWYWDYQSSAQLEGGYLVFHARIAYDETWDQIITDSYSLFGGIPTQPPTGFTYAGPAMVISDEPASRSVVLVPVPEPATLSLLGLGAVALMAMREGRL